MKIKSENFKNKKNEFNSLVGHNLPGISVVIIGLNVQRFLGKCISAVLSSNYPKGLLEIIYVDSGSSDKSIEIASSYKEVNIVKLNTDHPNAAKGRNAGLAAAGNEVIQFVDADSYLHPDWLITAVKYIKKDIAAVTGLLNERYPDRNWYHRMANLEWNLQKGDTGWSTGEMSVRTFGGNVMIRRSILILAGGYDESMVAGEDPDLSYRVRNLSKTIYRIKQVMATHDIDMSTVSQYLTRTKRSGYAYAFLSNKHWKSDSEYFRTIMLRIIGGGLVPPGLMILGVLSGYPILGLISGLAVALRLLFKTRQFSRLFSISKSMSVQYVFHLAVAVYPQAAGALKYYIKAGIKSLNEKINHVDRNDMTINKSSNNAVSKSAVTAG